MSEVVAYMVSGILYNIIGPRLIFVGSFAIAIVGSVFYVVFG